MINRSIGCEEIFMLPEAYSVDGDLFEFGVYNGNNMKVLVNQFASRNKPFGNIWGFDSFIGLPEEDESVKHLSTFYKGEFNVLDDYLMELEAAKNMIRGHVDRDDINFVVGFFSESLTDDIAISLKDVCGFLHVDCDLYISAKQCLNWLFKHAILKNGCIIRYDDWDLTPEWIGGESLAHKEIENKFHIQFNRLAKNVFMVLDYDR